MRYLIITHVDHYFKNGKWYAYAPYVREMNIWLKFVEEVIIVAPEVTKEASPIDIAYEHPKIKFVSVPLFDVTSASNLFKTFIKLPAISYKICGQMRRADHIHLRCPGNMGLLGTLFQIAFPKKRKTAKYAGNWDLASKQPATYKLQRRILRNTFLTRNMQVLVYGDWPDNTTNIKPFFTATYHEADKKPMVSRNYEAEITCLFVGLLAEGKQPLYAVKLVEEMRNEGCNIRLEVYGDGLLKNDIENYIDKRNLRSFINVMGAKGKTEVEEAYRNAHFLILPSKSEGWPKVVAEAMFWGCVPLVTSVSCVPYMLDYGKRGVLLTMDKQKDKQQFIELIQDKAKINRMVTEGVAWSRDYTLDKFEEEIRMLL